MVTTVLSHPCQRSVFRLDIKGMAVVARPWNADQRSLLVQAYVSERVYDAQTLSALTGVFATIIGVLSVVGSALAFGSLHPRGLVVLLLAFLPVIPLPFLAWGAQCANIITTRGEVIAMYEEALQDVFDMRLGEDRPTGLPVPFGTALVSRAWWGRGRWVMTLGLFVIAVMYLLILGVSAYYARQFRFVVLADLICGGGFYYILLAYARAFFPHEYVARVVSEVFGPTAVPALAFSPNREKYLIGKALPRGIARPVVLGVVVFGVAFFGYYSQVWRHQNLRGNATGTQAAFFGAELAKAMNNRVLSLTPMTHKKSEWLLRFDRPAQCFILDTKHFDLAGPRGFSVVRC
jgi:hypothetical protein